MTFKKYIESGLKNRDFNSPAFVDFAAQILTDENFKDDLKKWDEIEWCFIFRGADRLVIKAAKLYFSDWQESSQAPWDVGMR